MSTIDLIGETQYLTFLLGGEEYAMPILRVREIVAFEPLTRVPRMPAFIRGVMNLRGTVLPVIDLSVKLGMAPSEITRTTCILTVEMNRDGETTSVGLLADEVRQVVDFASSQIEPAPAFGTRLALEFLQGMGRMESRFALILNLDKLLSALELEAAAAAAGALASDEIAAQQETSAKRPKKKAQAQQRA
jgi:purine-binding chemotaxis protein CheW